MEFDTREASLKLALFRLQVSETVHEVRALRLEFEALTAAQVLRKEQRAGWLRQFVRWIW